MKKLFKNKKARIALILVAIIVAGLIIKNVFLGGGAEIGTAMVDTVPVEVRDLSDTIALTGTIQGESTTNITSVAAAKFTEVNVAVGDIVSEGQVLASLDAKDIEIQIQEVSTNLGRSNTLKQIATNDATAALYYAQADKNTAVSEAQTAIDRANAAAGSANADLAASNGLLDSYKKLKTAADKAAKELAAAETALSAARDELAAVPEGSENDAARDAAQAKVDAANEKATAAAAAKAEADTKLANKQSSIVAAYGSIAGLEAKIQSAAEAVTAANHGVEDANSAMSKATTTADRAIAAAASGLASNNNALVDYTAADTLKELNAAMEDCTLKAPVNGVVTSVACSVGDKNTPGAAVITIANTGNLIFSAMVDEKDIMKLEEGMKATLTTNAVKDNISGTITRIVRVKQTSKDGTASGYPVEITVDNRDLLIGMNAKARIVMNEMKGILSVAYDHVQTDEDGNTFVLVAVPNEDGTTYTVEKRMIQVGQEVNYFTEVTGGDLKEGDLTFYDSEIKEGDVVYISSDFGMLEE